MAELSGKVALVTGGASGIGKAICEQLLEEKVKVCIGDIDLEQGEETVKELATKYGEENVMFEKFDVSNESEFENALKRTKSHFGGHLDILINNAGIANESEWRRLLDVNLFGVANGVALSQKYLSSSSGEKGGIVINIASVAGLISSPYVPSYTASKFGVIGLTLSWGHKHNVQKTNIKVNAVCPDITETDILVQPKSTLDDVVIAQLRTLKQEGKLLKPVDIANGVIKILRDDVSGAVLVVSRSKGAYYYPVPSDDILSEEDKI